MITREEFLSIPERATELRKREDRIKCMKSKLLSPKGLDTSDKVQSSGSQTALIDIFIDMEQTLDAEKQELEHLQAEALKVIYRADLPSEQRMVMLLRYTENATWRSITETVHYGIATVFRIHRAALDKLFKVN